MIIDSEIKKQLVEAAIHVRNWSYSPYSKYAVGAAILTSSGKVYDGANVENAVFPLTMCAERVAVFNAVSQGELDFEAVAVVTENAGTPCGSCRQVLAEYGLDTLVIIADHHGTIHQEKTVAELLPGAFTPKDLPKS
ncbi:MAG: cytidine deaminase [Anaerolineaceae bacterium]|nr:cytidine deaminase [Anaerolineaceae bacterium]